MMNDLNREAAGLPESVWDRIDASVLEAASDVLTGRRFLDLDGPYGLGLTSLESGPETIAEDGGDECATTIGSRALPVPLLQRSFSLSHRRVCSSGNGACHWRINRQSLTIGELKADQ